jgi:rSAM/selenodomain-associated transferase 1
VKLLVIAKAPEPGRSKTRLCPPCSPEEAAALAEAALADTLCTVAATPVDERVLVLEGAPGDWLPAGFRVVPQRGDGLDERLAAAFDDAGGPALLIGMDTPQVTPAHLADALARLARPGTQAVLGEAIDGGWWAIGLRTPEPRAFLGVPMSTASTCDAQRTRLSDLGLRVDELPHLRDVDVIADAHAVAAAAPGSRFAAALATIAPVREGSVTEVEPLGAGAPRAIGAPWTAVILTAAALLMRGANHVGRRLQEGGVRMQVNAPPLTGNVDPRVRSTSLAAIAVGAVGIAGADRWSQRLAFRRLLWLSFGAALAWGLALAFWDGSTGLTRSPLSAVDYLRAVPFVRSPDAFIGTFFERVSGYPSHVRVHPPGMVLLLWGMGQAGFGGAGWAAALEHMSAAASVPAVLLAIREIAGETRARAAAPFLMLTPAAVFWSSGDAVFLGVGAWAAALLILSTGRRGRRADLLALAGGALAGAGLFLSYGLVLLGLVPLSVAVARRRWRTLAVAALPILAWVGWPLLFGWSWVEASAVTRREYGESLARVRPYGYFVFANPAALLIALGPAVWVALARLRDRRLWVLVGAALVAVAVADLSGLTKGEVERIWLPYMPWITAATGAAFVGSGQRRRWLAAGVGWALVVQLVVFSPW